MSGFAQLAGVEGDYRPSEEETRTCPPEGERQGTAGRTSCGETGPQTDGGFSFLGKQIFL